MRRTTHKATRKALFCTQREEWILEHECERCSHDWHDFVLRNTTYQHKHTWRFGHNGKRLTRCRDAGVLAQYEPEIYIWVDEQCGNVAREPWKHHPEWFPPSEETFEYGNS